MNSKPSFGSLAASLLLLGSLPVCAQSNVSISGWLDLGVIKKTGGATQLSTLGRSNLSFAGNEDLGGGLAATFRISTRFELDTGAVEATDSQRTYWKDESTVGLKGPWGALRLGRGLTALWAQSWVFDAWSNFDRTASPHWWQFEPDFLSGPEIHDYARINNGLFYDSPSLNGFSAHVSYSPERGPTALARPVSASFNYDSRADGQLSVMVSGEQNSQKDKAAFFGAGYTLGGIRWLVSYNHVKLNTEGLIFGPDWTNWAAASEKHSKRTSVNFSASYTTGPNTLRAGLGRDFQGSTNGFNFIGSNFTKAATGFSGPSNFVSAAYVYAFSKRTSVLVDASRTDWKYTDDNGRTAAYGYAAGITHAF